MKSKTFDRKGNAVVVFIPTKLHDQIDDLYAAFVALDEKIYNDNKEEIESTGHPFTICTNIASWLKETLFTDAKVMGFDVESNPTAEIGQNCFGHDFLVIEGRYIIDFWYRFIEAKKDAPILLDMIDQKELVARYYGDPDKWVTLEDPRNDWHDYIK